MLQFPRAKKKEMIQERCQEEKREKYDNLAQKSAGSADLDWMDHPIQTSSNPS